MIELDKYEQQIILACKGWSKWSEKEDRLKATRVVLSQYYGLEEEYLVRSPDGTYQYLLELFLKIKENNIFYIKRFIEGLFKDYWHGGEKKEISKEHVIKNLISEIGLISIKDSNGNDLFVELEPNYEILNYGFKEKATLEDVLDLIIKADNTDERGDKFETNKYGGKNWITKWIQYKRLQNFAFSLEDREVKVSQELADFLNERYNNLMIDAEDENERELSGDYLMDFNCWVKGKENTPRCW